MKVDHATLLRPPLLFISTHSRLHLRLCGSLSVSEVVRLATPTYSRSWSPHFRSSSLSHATSRLPIVSTFNRLFFFDPIAAFAKFLLLRVREVTLEFRSFTANAVGANSPLLGWIRLDTDLNENVATFQLYLWGSVPYRHSVLWDSLTDMCKGMARGRLARDKKDAWSHG
ncbi:hypothetical protein E6C27_scaffold498G001190 [Cucumis melo var. makuwa]|uniref:Uncharacterized protein n=1 Tax=Cucumis melo var. makuwa TaxID=1194695 RepID=A0A5A7TZU6_CUCMM|nr:hypothetical protein E6C27_scaffold498G001190 [Cucumis melo var. makuwa]